MKSILEIAKFLEFLGEPILIINAQSKIVFANSACLRLFAYSHDAILKLRVEDLTANSENLKHAELVDKYIQNNSPAKEMTDRSIMACVNSQGHVFNTRISIATARVADEKYGVAILQDYTSIQNIISELEDDSNMDMLTGLYNRRYLKNILDASGRIHSTWNSIGVLYMDLNNFKPVNDSFGHKIGDEVIKAVAHRLKDSVRFDDVVFRLGGDEFMVLINLNDVSHKSRLLSDISKKIAKLIAQPIPVKNESVNIGVSIGAGIYPDNQDDLDELINLADKAMYLSKVSGASVTFVDQLPEVAPTAPLRP